MTESVRARGLTPKCMLAQNTRVLVEPFRLGDTEAGIPRNLAVFCSSLTRRSGHETTHPDTKPFARIPLALIKLATLAYLVVP